MLKLSSPRQTVEVHGVCRYLPPLRNTHSFDIAVQEARYAAPHIKETFTKESKNLSGLQCLKLPKSLAQHQAQGGTVGTKNGALIELSIMIQMQQDKRYSIHEHTILEII